MIMFIVLNVILIAFVVVNASNPCCERREILARLGRRPYKSIAPCARTASEIARQELIGGVPLERLSREEIIEELEILERRDRLQRIGAFGRIAQVDGVTTLG